MGYHVVEAIIEDGQLRQVGEKLPPGTIRAHLIYDVEDNPSGQEENPDIVRATSGIYRDVDVDTEMRTLRGEWEREPEVTLLVDTNILIYHVAGSMETIELLNKLIARNELNISILTKIEFLGWHRHTPEGFEVCSRLIERANVYPLTETIAVKAIELKRQRRIGLADSVIAATVLVHHMGLATRNTDDFKGLQGIEILNPFV